MILEGLYKSKLQNSAQLQNVLALYVQEIDRNNGKSNYSQLKTAVKLHIYHMMRTRSFRVRNDVVEQGSVTKRKKGQKAYVERRVGECFQWKAHGQCSKGDSCKEACTVVRDEKDRLLAHRIRRHSRLTARDKNLQRNQAIKRTTLQAKRANIPCRFKFCENPSCKFWHPPVCQNYKSEKGCVYGDKCHFRRVAEGTPNKRSKY